MKTTKKWSVKSAMVQVSIFLTCLVACQQENDILNSVDTQNVNSESESSALVSENSDMATTVIGGITTTQYTGGRTDDVISSFSTDARLGCAVITIARTGTPTAPAGTITIDFGNGNCVNNNGVVRKGKIIVTYSGRRWVPGSSFTIQFADFYRNANLIEGTISVTTQLSADSLHLQFLSALSGGKITFGDGKTVERNDSLTRTWYRSLIPENDEWHIEGHAWGTNKSGNQYQMEIKETLIQKISCLITKKVFIPVKGKKVISVTGTSTKVYTVDYGDGTCDNEITVILSNGKEKVINVSSDGN